MKERNAFENHLLNSAKRIIKCLKIIRWTCYYVQSKTKGLIIFIPKWSSNVWH